MLHRAAALSLGFALATTLACTRPLGFFSGGPLEGSTSPAPTSWAFTDEIDTVQLETQPADPYSVNIWVTRVGEHLYVHSGTNRATWIEHMEADPRVRMRIGEQIYALAAERVPTQAEFDRFIERYEVKYGRRPRNENIEEAYLFRLSPRG